MKFIFEVRMKPGYTVDEYADAWVRASKPSFASATGAGMSDSYTKYS